MLDVSGDASPKTSNDGKRKTQSLSDSVAERSGRWSWELGSVGGWFESRWACFLSRVCSCDCSPRRRVARGRGAPPGQRAKQRSRATRPGRSGARRRGALRRFARCGSRRAATERSRGATRRPKGSPARRSGAPGSEAAAPRPPLRSRCDANRPPPRLHLARHQARRQPRGQPRPHPARQQIPAIPPELDGS